MVFFNYALLFAWMYLLLFIIFLYYHMEEGFAEYESLKQHLGNYYTVKHTLLIQNFRGRMILGCNKYDIILRIS